MRRFVLAAIALLATACAKSEPAKAPVAQTKPASSLLAPPEPGLPMWVIRDADSTIYLTGTVHALPPDLKWASPKLEAALKEANTLWLEIAIPEDLDKFRHELQPTVRQHSLSSGPPLSKRLSEKERKTLTEALKAAGLSEKEAAQMDKMKPWYVSNIIATSTLASAGFEADSGIDNTLAAKARKLGHEVKGLETAEFQIGVIDSGTEEQQLRSLRAYLAMPPAFLKASGWVSSQAFRAWANGNKIPVEAMITLLETAGKEGAGMDIDALLKNRNEDWAGKIEQMLKGSGVDFIAVGAGHLVGPDSVQNRLAARGIKAEPY